MESQDNEAANAGPQHKLRQRTHALIARSSFKSVRAAFDRFEGVPKVERLRPTEVGLVMVQGRVGGTGGRFNLGELPVARAAVRLPDGTLGVGYVAGRDCDHAELAALADAMIQHESWKADLESVVLTPLEAELAAARAGKGRKAAATKVDFFTMVRTRGEK